MAHIQPLRALRYDLDRVGRLDRVVSPPYDVITPPERALLAAQSPYNVVAVDLPEGPAGQDPYEAAAQILASWERDGALVRDRDPALWGITQRYFAPGGGQRERHGFFCRVRVEDYGPGRIRPHERTHPGPKEDRLRLTRATRVNLSPIFALFSDAGGAVSGALEPHLAREPWAGVTDADGTEHRVFRIADPDAILEVQEALAGTELLIADGHHRYETARVYHQERGGGEGEHGYVLMCLVALEDPGLTVFPTHRLVRGLDDRRREALREAISQSFDVEETSAEGLVPEDTGTIRFGYLDAHHRRPLMLTLRDQRLADAALPGMPEAYRRLDTAVLEAMLLKGALEMTEEDISHLDGLGYARDGAEARSLVESGEYDAAFFMGATPVERVQEVAAAGENMPPKSTYFYPKVPTGLLFNPLDEPPRA
jgi:uncharacterized protein (DUF1015 family)